MTMYNEATIHGAGVNEDSPMSDAGDSQVDMEIIDLEGDPISQNRDCGSCMPSHVEPGVMVEEPRRKIRFAETHSQVEIEPFYEFSDEELGQVWYTTQETSLFEVETKNTIKAYKKAVFGLEELDPSVHCLRGLEDRIATKDYMVRKGLQMEYTRGVLLEQERQRKLGLKQPFGMHERLGISTKWATLRAIELAVGDADEASASAPKKNSLTQRYMKSMDRVSSTLNTRRMDSLALLRRRTQRAQPHMQHQSGLSQTQYQQQQLGGQNAQWSSRGGLTRTSSGGSAAGSTTNASWGDASAKRKSKNIRDFALMA